MFKRSQARKGWQAYKQRWPMVEKTQGFVTGFGARLDDAESKGKATSEAIAKCQRGLKDLTAAVDAEIAALTTLSYAYTVNDGVVKKAQAAHTGPLEKGILPMWQQFVKDCELSDVTNAIAAFKELRKKTDEAGAMIESVHGLFTRNQA